MAFNAGRNLYLAEHAVAKAARTQQPCVFLSHRLADIDTARSVAAFLTNTVDCNVYSSENDASLKDALSVADHERVVQSIDKAIDLSTHLIGIISNRTKGSWWVPYEIGGSRRAQLSIALLMLEEVSELPSYLRIARLLRDSDDLTKWATETSSVMAKALESVSVPRFPRVALYRGAYPMFK
jgi:hypothetical protein